MIEPSSSRLLRGAPSARARLDAAPVPTAVESPTVDDAQADQVDDAVLQRQPTQVPLNVRTLEVPRLAAEKAPSYDGQLMGANAVFYPSRTPLKTIVAVMPSDGRVPEERAVLVNGMLTTPKQFATDLQALADSAHGVAAIGIYNATDGFRGDVSQAFHDDFSDCLNNPATKTLVGLMRDAVRNSRPLHVIGHSQGGSIVAAAVRALSAEMRASGLSKTAIRERLGCLHIETFGSAARRYADGPAYVHYVNVVDPIVSVLGGVTVGLARFNPMHHRGRGAVVRGFITIGAPAPAPNTPDADGVRYVAKANDNLGHGAREVYFPQRMTFDDARAKTHRQRFLTRVAEDVVSAVWLPPSVALDAVELGVRAVHRLPKNCDHDCKVVASADTAVGREP